MALSETTLTASYFFPTKYNLDTHFLESYEMQVNYKTPGKTQWSNL